MLRVQLFGGVAAEWAGRPVEEPASRRATALFGWLALHPGLHSRAEVAARLWPDVLDASARQSMRSALWSLRQVLPEDALVSTRDRIGLRPDTTVDLVEFERHLADGRLEQAVSLATGDLLAGVDDEWALVARDACTTHLIEVLLTLADRDTGDAVAWARRAAALDPLSEEAGRVLMSALADAGDRPAALAVYRKLAERLRRELRLTPSEPTWTLAEQIRTQLPDAPASRSAPGLLALAGRDLQVRTLGGAWRGARARRGGLALVHGEPGVGKTRLVAQLVDLAERDGALVATGGVPDLPGPPLAAWIEICAALAGRVGRLPDAPWVAALAPLLPALVPSTGSRLDPGLEQSRLFEAVVALVGRCARREPVLVVIEDVHAADQASLALLAYLSRRVAELPVLMVETRRERPVRDQLATLEHAARQNGTLRADVGLGPLDASAVAQLARGVGALSDDAVDRVIRVADGNALLAVEAARALAAGDELPVGLRAAVRAAAAKLPGPARELVTTMAVAGRDLTLAEAAIRTGVELVAALPPAEDQGLLECVGHRVRFRHALLREAFYADLPAVERIERHLRAAALLRPDLERAAEAAAHLRAAGRVGDAGALLVTAAGQARAVGALADATELLREACEAMPQDATAALEFADVLAWRGRPADAQAAFDAALPLLEHTGDPTVLAGAYLRFAEWHYGPICQPRVAVGACRRAIAVIDGAGVDAPELRSRILAVLAWCEAIGGELVEVDRALAMLDEVSDGAPIDPVLAGAAHRARCFSLLRQGRFDDAVAPGILAAEAVRSLGRPDLVYAGLVNAAFGATAAGRLDDALALLDRAATAVTGSGMLAIEAMVLVDRAWVLVRMGRLADAAEAAAQARRTADRLDAPDLQAVVDAERGRVALRAGRYEDAAALLAAALRVEDASIGRPLARLQRAEALVRLGRTDDAESELADVVTEPVRPGDWPDTLVARMAGVEGLVAAARGDRPLAARRYRQAAEGWRRRLSAAELGQRLSDVMVDLGRPIIGIVVPAEELALVEADAAALEVQVQHA